MVTSKLSGVKIKAIASAVPKRVIGIESVAQHIGEKDARKISESIGVNSRHVASDQICTSDLCYAAARKLLADLNWTPDTIDGLIFVSQTPDYIMPATSCALHGRLNLSKSCAALDINLGCSGYVYGLWTASQFISSGNLKRVLLLVGDTISRLVSPQDRPVLPLFGDAGTATLLEADPNASDMTFNLGTDGKRKDLLIVPAGAFRHPSTTQTAMRSERESGNSRSDEDLFMDGAEVFTFTLREVPSMIKSILSEVGWDLESVDAFVLHQANRFIVQYLAKHLKIPSDKLVLAMEEFGNTSSASIPLAMTHALQERLSQEHESRLILSGFGTGLSWGSVALTCSSVVMPDLILIGENEIELPDD